MLVGCHSCSGGCARHSPFLWWWPSLPSVDGPSLPFMDGGGHLSLAMLMVVGIRYRLLLTVSGPHRRAVVEGACHHSSMMVQALVAIRGWWVLTACRGCGGSGPSWAFGARGSGWWPLVDLPQWWWWAFVDPRRCSWMVMVGDRRLPFRLCGSGPWSVFSAHGCG